MATKKPAAAKKPSAPKKPAAVREGGAHRALALAFQEVVQLVDVT